MKKIYILFSGWLALLLLALPVTAQAQVNYAVSGSTAYVATSPNASGNIVIAATYNGHPVTSIGDGAFEFCLSLKSVTIPDSVTSIGGAAFYSCTSLTNVTIPDSVTSIGDYAFEYCPLTSVTIPDSVTSIGVVAFEGCPSLTSVTIGNSVTSIGHAAFLDCDSLTNITVDTANPAYSSSLGVLFNKAQTTLIQFPGGLGGSYVIPNSVTSIGDGAFEYCYILTTITIPDSVTSIGDQAFSSTSLTSITIPDSVTSIGVVAFDYCISLTNVTIGNSVTSIGDAAFDYCTSLTSITIPNSVTSIGDGAFRTCSSLTGVTFLGNAPALGGSSVFTGVNAGAKVYYYAGTTGWGATYGGLPTVELFAPPQIGGGGVRVQSGNFSFTITGVSGQTFIVEASTNMVNWQPVWTNTLSGASTNFSDPQWTNYPRRFYRAR